MWLPILVLSVISTSVCCLLRFQFFYRTCSTFWILGKIKRNIRLDQSYHFGRRCSNLKSYRTLQHLICPNRFHTPKNSCLLFAFDAESHKTFLLYNLSLLFFCIYGYFLKIRSLSYIFGITIFKMQMLHDKPFFVSNISSDVSWFCCLV